MSSLFLKSLRSLSEAMAFRQLQCFENSASGSCIHCGFMSKAQAGLMTVADFSDLSDLFQIFQQAAILRQTVKVLVYHSFSADLLCFVDFVYSLDSLGILNCIYRIHFSHLSKFI